MRVLACSDHDSTCVQLEVLPNGRVAKILLHNLTYAQIAAFIENVSDNKIRSDFFPDIKPTFSTKDASWDGIIWALFTTPEMQVVKKSEGVYEVVPRLGQNADGK